MVDNSFIVQCHYSVMKVICDIMYFYTFFVTYTNVYIYL